MINIGIEGVKNQRNQITNIRATFEKSLTIWNKDRERDIFRIGM